MANDVFKRLVDIFTILLFFSLTNEMYRDNINEKGIIHPRMGTVKEVSATEWKKFTFNFSDNNISHPFCKQELWWCANYTLLPAPRS